MNILIIGGLGYLGKTVVYELKSRNHNITILDKKTQKNRKTAKELKKITDKIVFGDLENKEILKKTIGESECIIHLLEVVPPLSEDDSELCMKVNVKGTENIIKTIKEDHNDIPLIFVSSATVMGNTQLQIQHVNTSRIPKPDTIYAKSKLQAEELLKNSNIKYCILRLTCVIDTNSEYSDDFLKLLFDFPLNAKNEFLLGSDAATAIVNASESFTLSEDINKKVYFIGGGYQNGFQLTNRIFVESLFDAIGIGVISESCFIKNNPLYSLNWFDTKESNQILNYQNHSFDEYIKLLKNKTQSGGIIVKKMAPKLKNKIEMQSPYLEQNLKEN